MFGAGMPEYLSHARGTREAMASAVELLGRPASLREARVFAGGVLADDGVEASRTPNVTGGHHQARQNGTYALGSWRSPLPRRESSRDNEHVHRVFRAAG
jgi:hypothetical protein